MSYSFSLDGQSVIVEAFSRCGISPVSITAEQTASAIRSLNLELQSWANKGPNLWEIQKDSITLLDGVETYSAPINAVFIFEAFIRQNDAQSNQNDRIITPLSVNDYAMIPNKQSAGLPTVYWFNRQINPEITVWQVPNPADAGNGPWLLQYYYMSQVQDASGTIGQTPNIPYRFIDALCAGLAARLARKYAPMTVDALKMEAAEALLVAQLEDENKNVPLWISPEIQRYYNF